MTMTSSSKAHVAPDATSPPTIDSDLSLDFLRVVEQAAIACAHTMGQGDRHKSDQVAVETMRRVMDSIINDRSALFQRYFKQQPNYPRYLKAMAPYMIGKSSTSEVMERLDIGAVEVAGGSS